MDESNNTQHLDIFSSIIVGLINTCDEFLSFCEQRNTLRTLLKHLNNWRIFYGPNDSSLCSMLNDIGNILKDSQVSIFFYKEQLRIEAYYLGVQHPDLASTLNSIGEVYATNDRLLDAEKYFVEALNLLINKRIQKGRLYALVNYNLGKNYFHQSKYDDAIQLFNLAVKEQEDTVGAFSIDLAQMHLNIGKFMLETGKIQDSMRNLQRALMIMRMLDGTDFKLAEVLHCIGLIHEASAEYAEALNCFHQSLIIARSANNNVGIILNLYKICIIYRSIGDVNNATITLEVIINILKEKVGKKNICVASALGLLRSICIEHGMIEKSKVATKEIEEIILTYGQSSHDSGNELEIVDFVINLFGYIIDDNSTLVAAAA